MSSPSLPTPLRPSRRDLRPRPPRAIRLVVGATVLALALVAGACGGGVDGVGSAEPAPSATGTSAVASTATSTATGSSGTDTSDGPGSAAGETGAAADPGSAADDPSPEGIEYPTGIVPTRIVIPAIDVDAPTIELALGGAAPEVPDDFDDTGWYTGTRRPGEIGPAVLAGHIDSVAGPAVFARLDELVEGDEITVVAADGETRTFEVTGAGQYPKEALPDEVFGFGRPLPELRLITCGGTFDRSVGHYRDNLVVYAVEVGATEA